MTTPESLSALLDRLEALAAACECEERRAAAAYTMGGAGGPPGAEYLGVSEEQYLALGLEWEAVRRLVALVRAGETLAALCVAAVEARQGALEHASELDGPERQRRADHRQEEAAAALRGERQDNE